MVKIILGIGGNLSGGKTITAVKYCYEESYERKVISNINLKFPNVEVLSNEYIIEFLKYNFENEKVIEEKFKGKILLLDEISNFVNARKFNTAINELFLMFFMMSGKIDLDILYTYQVRNSHVDVVLREVTSMFATCFRLDSKGQVIIGKKRILEEDITIAVIFELEMPQGNSYSIMTFNPKPYYNLYDTRELSLLDRTKYLRGGLKDLRRF